MNQNIQNIIFDLGGVLLNIDYQKTIEAFSGIGVKDFENIFTQFHQDHIAQQFEKGLINDSAFRDYIRFVSNRSLTNAEIDTAWNAMLLDFPLQHYQLLCSLKAKYRLFLLSNTNSIHYRAFQEIVRNTLPIPSLDVLFDKAYYSHIIKLRKPDASVFEYIIQEQQLNPKQTLFIDDSLQHIETAKALQLNVIHLKDSADLFEMLRQNHLV